MKRLLLTASLGPLLTAFMGLLPFQSFQTSAYAQATCPAYSPAATLVAGATYKIGGSDNCHMLVITVPGAVITVPPVGTNGELIPGYHVQVFNASSSTITLAGSLNGVTNPTIGRGYAAEIYASPEGWYAPYTSATPITGGGGSPSSGSAGDIQAADGGGGFTAIPTGIGIATLLTTPSSANLAAAITDETGSGALVFGTSPTLVGPILGTPASGNLLNMVGLPIGTGVSGLGTNVATFLGTASSANLRLALTDETGTGSAVFATSPVLVTPNLGIPSAVDLTNATNVPLSQAVGNLAVSHLNGGSGATSGTFWAWDGTWRTPAGGGGGGTPCTTIAGSLQFNDAGAFGCATLGTGFDLTAGALSHTSVVADKSSVGQAIVAGDSSKTVLVGAFTYTLAQAGSTGFGSGWGACLLNTSSGNATLTTTTSTFKGAGGATSMTLRPQAWACPTSDGVNYPTVWGSVDGGDLITATVTNAKLATMLAHRFKGNNTGSTGAPLDLTATQLTAELNEFVGDTGSGGTKGLVPAPLAGDAGKVLSADGTWIAAGAVAGPGSSTSGFIPTWTGTGGDTLGTGLAPTGSGAGVATTSGAFVNGHGVAIDASGNLVDAGGPPSIGGGGGTVSPGTVNQIARYAATGTVVSGDTHLTDNNSILTVMQAVAFSGTLTPPALSGNVNDYNPTGLSTTMALRLDGGVADRTITSLAGGVEGRIMVLTNIGATNSIILANNSGSSSPGNKFLLPGTVTLLPNRSFALRYDATSPGNWRPLSAGGVAVSVPTVGWVPGSVPTTMTVFTASQPTTVIDISAVNDVLTGGTTTFSLFKAPSGTACASGTALHTGSFNANANLNTPQILTLSSTASDLVLAPTDRVCAVANGAGWTTSHLGAGAITVKVGQ